eukprot:Opistho-1_new@6697
MNKQSHSYGAHSAQDRDTRATRFGLRVAAGLTERSEALPHDVSERLRFAREQALTKARAARAAQAEAAPASQVLRAGGALALGGMGNSSPRWLKFASVLPLCLLVAGLLLIDHGQWYEQVSATAEIDTALLSDNLPPAAYGDPGFSEYLADEQTE